MIRFGDSVTKKWGKPHVMHEAEIRWAFLNHEQATEKELMNSDFDTLSLLSLKFDESQPGKRLYFCLRWESPRKISGLLSIAAYRYFDHPLAIGKLALERRTPQACFYKLARNTAGILPASVLYV